MIKKIKHMETLRLQQLLLQERKRKLEAKITNDWSEFKKSFYPRNLVREAFFKWLGKK